MSQCPPDDIWQRWFRKWLVPTPREEQILVSHLEMCANCRRKFLAEYARLMTTGTLDVGHISRSLIERVRELSLEILPVPSSPPSEEPSPPMASDAQPDLARSTPSAEVLTSPQQEKLASRADRWPSGSTPPPSSSVSASDAASSCGLPQAPVQVDHYRILRRIGEGAMGVVFEAEDVRTRKRVALKFMKPDLAQNETSRQRFLREARIAASLKHPNIVAIYEVGEFSSIGIPYLAMEYLAGESLRERLKRHGPLPWREVCRLGAQVAEGLAAAHQRGLVHRDVKPANIWLQEPGQHIKILDFGLARFQDQDVELTKSGVVVGTPAYMSPEQIRGWELDDRSDIFSLGIVLYECLVGRRPFHGDDLYAIISQVLTETPPSPKQLRPDVPADVSGYVMKLLEKDRAQRPKTAVDVAETLQRLAVMNPVEQTKRAAYAATSQRLPESAGPAVITPSPVGISRPDWLTPAADTAEAPEQSTVAVEPSKTHRPKRRRKRRRNNYWRWILMSLAIVIPLTAVYLIASSLWNWYYQSVGTLVVEIEEEAQPYWQGAELRIFDHSHRLAGMLRGQNKQIALSPGNYTVQCVGSPKLELNKREVIILPRRVTPLLVRLQRPSSIATAPEPVRPQSTHQQEPERWARE